MNLSADDNIQVCNVTTPAQFFHMIRRQIKRNWIKPLVVMTPKSLLRHADCVSPLEDFTDGGFQKFIPDTWAHEKPSRLLLCSGGSGLKEKKRENVQWN